VTPAPNETGVSPTVALQIVLGDGDAAQVDQTAVEAYLNEVKVTATPQKDGTQTRLEFDSLGLPPANSNNKVRLLFKDNAPAANTRSEEWTFTVRNYVSLTLPPPLYFENFDSTVEGSLPTGSTEQNFTDQAGSSSDTDFGLYSLTVVSPPEIVGHSQSGHVRRPERAKMDRGLRSHLPPFHFSPSPGFRNGTAKMLLTPVGLHHAAHRP
jgi:hypothetical protein